MTEDPMAEWRTENVEWCAICDTAFHCDSDSIEPVYTNGKRSSHNLTHVCENCLDETAVCPECGDRFFKDDLSEDENYMCDDCVRKMFMAQAEQAVPCTGKIWPRCYG